MICIATKRRNGKEYDNKVEVMTFNDNCQLSHTDVRDL
jgi:hypothetical protein